MRLVDDCQIMLGGCVESAVCTWGIQMARNRQRASWGVLVAHFGLIDGSSFPDAE
jgi:hypothetical protein